MLKSSGQRANTHFYKTYRTSRRPTPNSHIIPGVSESMLIQTPTDFTPTHIFPEGCEQEFVHTLGTFKSSSLERGACEEIRVKLVIDLPDPLVGQVKTAVQEGGYENAREFVTTAIENQLELEEYGDNEFKTLDEAIEEFDTSESRSSDNQASEEEPQESTDVLTDGLGRQEYDAVPTVPPPDPERLDPGPLWGQYNRVFPAKIVVRRLANMVQDQNESGSLSGNGIHWIELDHFQDDAAQLARNYGLTIREYDKKKSRGRGEKVASGLPTGDDPDKSKDRFETHFIGYSDRNRNLTGAPPHLHFVDISDEDVSRIGITDAGLAFAELYNPLLDDGPDADEPLSAEERSFYLTMRRRISTTSTRPW